MHVVVSSLAVVAFARDIAWGAFALSALAGGYLAHRWFRFGDNPLVASFALALYAAGCVAFTMKLLVVASTLFS